ncbi:MAG: hypothetical protein ACREDI_04090, partial [Roseiarcus sp.]
MGGGIGERRGRVMAGGSTAATAVIASAPSASALPVSAANRGGKDIAFAVGIVLILCLFFLPVPAVMI